MRVLGIETSCDETGVAIYDSETGLLADCLHSQVEIHAEFGGVVPELASRDHVRKLLPLVQHALVLAKCERVDIDAIAYTAGPGLVGALLVGATFARSLAFAWQVPAVAVNHMEAHLLAPLLEVERPEFPFVALLVSGGHTQLIQVATIGEYTILGDTLDDAAGEAFDKVAKILGLAYPGGPKLANLALQGDVQRFRFPRPMVNRKGLDFSFSGLKTHAANCLLSHVGDHNIKADIAWAFQDAVVDTLAIKCKRALLQTGYARLVVAGGVSANSLLRERLTALAISMDAQVYYPRLEFCTDNGAMIAYTGYQRYLLGQRDDLSIKVHPRWSLAELE